ncbi:MAG: signal peptidase I [Acidimicrobiales bacterium]
MNAALLAAGVGIVLALTRFAFQFYAVPSGSMSPTLAVGGRIWVQKLGVDKELLRPGDIVVFKRPPTDHVDTNIADVVKRIVAAPGDVVSSAGGYLVVDGQVVREAYLRPGTRTTGVRRQVVPPGHYFVMGDNRARSYDSRFFGPIAATSIVGRVVAQVWPPSAIRTF